MAQRKGQSKERRRRRRARRGGAPTVLVLLCLLVGVVAIITAMTIFFKVQTFTLTGDTRYSKEHIIQASGLEPGDNLVLFDKFSIIDRIFDACPYLDTVQMRRRYPDRVEIIVTECVAVAVIEDEKTEILDIKIPSLTIPVKPGRNLAVIIEVAAMNSRQKKLGYNAAQDLLNKLGMVDDITGSEDNKIVNPF